MTDRPILFSAPMIRALLAGKKTQTRRLVKIVDPNGIILDFVKVGSDTKAGRPVYEMKGSEGQFVSIREAKHLTTTQYMPPYAAGDRLWVRENHAIVPRTAYRMSEGVQQTLRPDDNHDAAVYQAGWERSKPGRWRPSIHMPRWASRLTLIVKDVKIERLQAISPEDARDEGVERRSRKVRQIALFGASAEERAAIYLRACVWEYENLWKQINGAESWDENPWVVAVTFEVIKDNIDRVAV